MLIANSAWLFGLGAALAGAGSFLTGYAALKAARRKSEEEE